MGHLEINIEVDHRRADGLEEPHQLQIKIAGLDASAAWDRAAPILNAFLSAEEQMQARVDRDVQVLEERGYCNHTLDAAGALRTCSLPSGHRGDHSDGKLGYWPTDPWQERKEHL